MEQDQERRWVKRARRGDRKAVALLVDRYEREIYFYLYRMTRNVEDAKDLTQEVFIKVFRKMAGFRSDSSFRTWLYRIATNHALNFLKRRPPTGSNASLDTLSDPAPSVTSVLEKEEFSRHLHRAIDELPRRQKAVVILRVQEGLTYSEIAEVLECSIGNCKAAYHNAVKKLRERLKHEALL